MSELTDRTVLIAGATSASGRAVAPRAARRGRPGRRRRQRPGSHRRARGRAPRRARRARRPHRRRRRARARDARARPRRIDRRRRAPRRRLARRRRHPRADRGGLPRARALVHRPALREPRVLERPRRLARRTHRDRVVDDGRRRRLAGSANYTAIKAASESWMQALAQGFAKADAPAAAVTFRVRSLAGLEDELAASVVGLWRADAATLNGSVDGTRRARLIDADGADPPAGSASARCRR